MVEKWIGEFNRRLPSTNDTERSGRPKDVTIPEIIEKIHDIVLDDPKVNVPELAEAIGISIGSMVKILHEDLGMRKLHTRIGTTNKTVARTRWNCTKVSDDTTIVWKDMASVFWDSSGILLID